MTLYLVRHAMPAVNPATDPATWPLSLAGRATARELAGRLPAAALLVASPEPKAWQTLDPDRERDVVRDQRLAEVRRREQFSDDVRPLRQRYVSGELLTGWEPRADVARRFAAAVADARSRADCRDLVLASHGMAMTVWLSYAVGLADPGMFWSELLFPDVLAVDLERRTVARIAQPG